MSNASVVIWQKLYANSQLNFHVEDHIFHYEIYLRGEEQSVNNEVIYQSVSTIKFCVSSYVYEGMTYHFAVNPINKTAKCIEVPEIVFPWRKAYYTNLVLRKEELNFEEQLNKHLMAISYHIQQFILPKIEEEFKCKLKSKMEFST